jgi:hypothetical protein
MEMELASRDYLHAARDSATLSFGTVLSLSSTLLLPSFFLNISSEECQAAKAE